MCKEKSSELLYAEQGKVIVKKAKKKSLYIGW